MKRLVASIVCLLVLVAGGLVWWRMTVRKPQLTGGSACPPVRTTLAAIALAENPTARTYAAFGSRADVFTNVFAHAGLVAVTNGPADLVFVSGESVDGAICHWKECCATNGILAIHFDVRRKTFAAFRRELEALPDSDWRLWFPGRSDCLVTVDAAPPPRYRNAPRLADMMDLFVREGLFDDFAHAGIGSIAGLFASYVGSRADVLPAFGFATGEVVPECFVTKEVPDFKWLDFDCVDADIREPLRSEIRSMQVVRRMILQGDIHSRAGRQDEAMEAWTKAIKRNPDDPLILERICLLDVNAETFMKVGNFPMAAQCLETMVCLRPKDARLARRLARVVQQLGKKELAAAIMQRADQLERESLARKRGLPNPPPSDVSRPLSSPASCLTTSLTP